MENSKENSKEPNNAAHSNDDNDSSSHSIENENSRIEINSIEPSKSNDNASTFSGNQVNISNDTAPLRVSKQLQEDDYIELELNKGGNNIRCYTYEEEVPKLPDDLVVGNENSPCLKKRGLSSDQALEQVY